MAACHSMDLVQARALLKSAARERGGASSWQPASHCALPISDHTTIGLFAPRPDWFEAEESFFRELIDQGTRKGFECAFPRTHSDGRMTFCKVTSMTELQSRLDHSLKLREPTNKAPEVLPTLLFVPALCCDLRGHRVGRGGGFYDRYLAQHPEVSASIAVLHSEFVASELNTSWIQSWDFSVTGLLTESYFFNCQNTGEL